MRFYFNLYCMATFRGGCFFIDLPIHLTDVLTNYKNNVKNKMITLRSNFT